MMWKNQPTQEEVAKWFSGFKLHEGLEHSQYVGGIVAIEARQRGKSLGWQPFVTAATRIKYFWDYCDSIKAIGSIHSPRCLELDFRYATASTAVGLVAEASVSIWESTEIDADQSRRPLRSATGRKRVSQGYRYNNEMNPDFDAMMKAETGALARAMGQIGMLALPGSGVATAEDMTEYQQSEPAKEPVSAAKVSKPKAAADPRK